jgi:GNAT superfamily N-acetyltransferase
MLELTPTQFPSAQPLFRATHFGVLAAGTLEGGHSGRVFVDDPTHPRAGLVCTRAGYYFLAGQPDSAFLEELYALFTGELVPRQEAELGSPEVVLFFDPPEWRDQLFACSAPLRPLLIRKLRHVLPPGVSTSQDWQDALPPGLRLVPYSAQLLRSHPDLAGEAKLFFGSTEAFLEKSLGFCVLDGDTVASACSAVFVGGGEAEVSIHTAEAYRRRGFAYLSAAAFIAACRERGLHPIWGCWPENEPSVKLAQKLGFVLDCEQPVCLWVK